MKSAILLQLLIFIKNNEFHLPLKLLLSFRFQEIIPLEEGYMIGTEDTRPVAIWEHIIHETLNKCSDKSKFKCHSDSSPPARFNPSDCVLAMEK